MHLQYNVGTMYLLLYGLSDFDETFVSCSHAWEGLRGVWRVVTMGGGGVTSGVLQGLRVG